MRLFGIISLNPKNIPHIIDKVSLMLMKKIIIFVFFLFLTGTYLPGKAAAGQSSEAAQADTGSLNLPKNPFTRIVRDSADEMLSFDTSLLTFVSEDGQYRVTLAAAIHIGDTGYYQELNRRFQEYDAVLYEMVGDNDPRPSSERESGGFIGWVQRLSAVAMKLDFQIGSINYHAENFVHADMTTAEFAAGMKKRGDGFVVWFLRAMGYKMVQPAEPLRKELEFNGDLLKLIFLPNRSRTLRRMSVENLAELDSTIIPTEGKNGSTLITDRNDKALQILRRELDSGKSNLAIFYGAAHLPDFAKKLEKDFGMKPEKIEWLPCWKLD